MTTAERIEEMFGDGLLYRLPDGRELPDVCEAEQGRKIELRGETKWVFDDGSSIVESDGAGWDHGLSPDADCFCWDTCQHDFPDTGGHDPDCPHATTPCKECSDPYTAEEMTDGLCDDCEEGGAR